MMRKFVGLALATLAFAVTAHAQESAPELEGYRTDNYRAPVPVTLAGARVLATGEACRDGGFHRRATASAEAAEPSCGHGLAR